MFLIFDCKFYYGGWNLDLVEVFSKYVEGGFGLYFVGVYCVGLVVGLKIEWFVVD